VAQLGYAQSDSVRMIAHDTSATIPAFTTSSKPKIEQPVSWSRVGATAGTLGLSMYLLHKYQLSAWWSGQRRSFHVFDDPDYKKNYDKIGHAFGGYYTSHFFKESFNWAGMDTTQSIAFGALAGFLFEFYVEVEDGYATDWGFSRGDARADLAGATFFFLRNKIDVLKNFEFKWSYWPSEQLLTNSPDIPGQGLNFTDDYGGQQYWLTANVHNLLPQGAKDYWPNWLNLAFGVSGWKLDAKDEAGNNDFSKRGFSYWLSVDYDITKLWPESEYEILNFIRRSLDYWHFPAPAVRLHPEPRFYILFPLRMSIG